MLYKRQEPFRYAFNHPLNGEIYCIEEKGHIISNDLIKIEIIDISPSGLKIRSTTELSFKSNQQVSIRFLLDDDNIQLDATPVWQTNQFHSYFCGFKMNQTNEEKQEIIETLKNYSKKQYQLSKTKRDI